ncbi:MULTISPECIES: hypothetical protein [unclassified Paraburkholderia]|uniref:hypothetical protein n=1 Tax=unclassified Paraburkholderia TaxID=2615204 RepID=UPI002AB0634F|nr:MULTISPECIES: hypothetical protein [unclassified Paraburkholderia]
MNTSAPFVGLEKQDFETFQNTIKPVLDNFLADNPPPHGQIVEKDKAIRDMFDMIQGGYEIPWTNSNANANAAKSVGISACTAKEITVAIDCFSVFFEFLGVTPDVCTKAATALIGELTKAQLDSLSKSFQAISDADGAVDTATAVFNLISGIYDLTGIGKILDALEDNMSWYHWFIVGVVVTAQAVALFASDGASFIAELIVMTAFLTQLGIDAVSMADACGWIS